MSKLEEFLNNEEVLISVLIVLFISFIFVVMRELIYYVKTRR